MNTIDYYNKNAKKYFDFSISADMSKQYDMFLKYVRSNGKILDFGCGGGRDSKYFSDLGFKVDAIDGSEELCKLAREYTGLDIKCMDFSDLDKYDYYDGIWACSTLLHVKKDKMLSILKKLRDALKKDGYIYASFVDGQNIEQYREDGRYFNDLTDERFRYLSELSSLEVADFNLNHSTTQTGRDIYWDNYILKRR